MGERTTRIPVTLGIVHRLYSGWRVRVQPRRRLRCGMPRGRWPFSRLDCVGDGGRDETLGRVLVHVDRLPPGPMQDSDLLFPSETGGFRAASALDKPFRLVGEAIKLKKRVTSRAMRRTFQDLARNADIEAIVRQKICGHATQEMSELYSTVPQREIQAAVGAVISLAKYRELLRDSASWWESGGKGGKSETATRETLPSGRNPVGVEGIEPSASTV